MQAIGRIFSQGWRQPESRLALDEQIALVRVYMERTEQIGQLEEELRRIVSEIGQPGAGGRNAVQAGGMAEQGAFELPTEAAALRAGLSGMRRQQATDRPVVESILENQVRGELIEAGLSLRGFVWPPVQFTFVEPPLNLTVSRRERITRVHSRVLQTPFDPVTLGESERAIEARTGLSAHISRIGGMAVYPAMVVEQASLQWILSAIAHEWVHHYLFLYPLGLRYGSADDLTTINETVAEIIGDEIGDSLARRYYAETAPPASETVEAADAWLRQTFDLRPQSMHAEQQRWERPGRPLQFEFQREMRQTRLHVDTLLEVGLVETAETYMEARRRYFVAQGIPIRVLNQAYFAFHGSYATGGAASSPIGPQLQQLRRQSDDLASFLDTVRWFTSWSDLQEALDHSRQ